MDTHTAEHTPTLKEAYERIMASRLFRTDGEIIKLSQAFIDLVAAIKNEDTDSINWEMGDCTEACLSDLVVGAYWAFTECHGGQDCITYAALCALGTVFQPGCTGPPKSPEEGEWVAYEQVTFWLLNNPYSL